MQQNWKVKRQRFVGAALGSEGFSIDLFDNILYDSTAVFRPSPTSAVRVDHDSAGMLTVHVPPNSCHSIHFGFLASESGYSPSQLSDLKNISFANTSAETPSDEECIRSTHSVLRGAHKSIFDEQVCFFMLGKVLKHILFFLKLINQFDEQVCPVMLE